MIGRGAGLLADLKVDLQPMGWRFVDRAGRDSHRTSALLREDLDELAEAFDGYEGDLKVQIAGPWTLASSIWLHRGERAVVDVGATRDLIGSLAEGLRVHLGELARLVPEATLVVQIDEPGLPSVLSGELPTASGFGRIRAIDPTTAAEGLRDVVAAAGDRHTVVHCCAPDVPLVVLRNTGVKAVSLDTSLLSPKGWESVAATVESGRGALGGGDPHRRDPHQGHRGHRPLGRGVAPRRAAPHGPVKRDPHPCLRSGRTHTFGCARPSATGRGRGPGIDRDRRKLTST